MGESGAARLSRWAESVDRDRAGGARRSMTAAKAPASKPDFVLVRGGGCRRREVVDDDDDDLGNKSSALLEDRKAGVSS